MCMRKKGFTILELLVSIIILSVVLTFAMNLFLKVRNAYSNEKDNIDMELSRSILIDNVMGDASELKVNSLTCTASSVTIQYSKENQTIRKVLSFDKSQENADYVRYTDQSDGKTIVRKYPKGSLNGVLNCTSKSNVTVGTLYHVYFPIKDENDNDYSLDMFLVS